MKYVHFHNTADIPAARVCPQGGREYWASESIERVTCPDCLYRAFVLADDISAAELAEVGILAAVTRRYLSTL